MWQVIFASLLALCLTGLVAWRFRIARDKQRAMPTVLLGEAARILDNAEIKAGETAGTYELQGQFDRYPVRVKVIADTLAVRKLPSLWLMVTLPLEMPVRATLDVMMRPSGSTTFSNFDRLPITLSPPPGFSEEAVIRTDDPLNTVPLHVIARHMKPFFAPQAKELLITPKGLRIVELLAEADRARYGVFRQADFGDARLAPERLRDIILRLVSLARDIEDWHEQTS